MDHSYKAWLVLLTSSEFTSDTCHFQYLKALWQSQVRREEEADSWSWSAPEMDYFIDILDSANNFSLASQYKDIDIILLVEQIDNMKLSYQLFANKFLTQIVHIENGEYFYQRIKKILSKIT